MSARLSYPTAGEKAEFISAGSNKSREDYAAVELTFTVSAYSDYCYANLGIAFPASLSGAVVKRKAEYLAGRYAAKFCLQQLQLLGEYSIPVGGENYDLKIGAHRSPSWPVEIIGSITHAQGIACAVVASRARYRAVGVDIENWLSQDSAAQIKAQILTDSDYSQLARAKLQSDGFCENQQLTLVFSAKESLFKALYPSVGRYFDFKDAELTALDYTQQYLGLRLLRSLGPESWLQKYAEFKVEFIRRPDSVYTHLLVRQ